jgi:hypothetical protein
LEVLGLLNFDGLYLHLFDVFHFGDELLGFLQLDALVDLVIYYFLIVEVAEQFIVYLTLMFDIEVLLEITLLFGYVHLQLFVVEEVFLEKVFE